MKKLTSTYCFQLFYFLKYAAIGIFFPYMVLYFTGKGLNGIQIGLVLGILPLVKVVVQPVFSLIGDIYHINRALMFFSSVGTSLAILGLFLTDHFFPILLVMAFFSALETPAEPIVNALALDHLKQEKRQNDFGSLRLWGSAGFALASFLAGLLATDQTLQILPLLYALVSLVMALLTLLIPETEADTTSRPLTWMEGVKILPERPTLAIFLLGVMLVSAALNVTVQYLATYMEELHAAGWLIGLTIASQAIIEIPLMGATPRIIDRLGLKKSLLLGVMVMPLRWVLYFFIGNAWLVMPTQIFHSLPLVSVQVVAVSFVDRLVPNEWRATGQGLLSTSFRGIGPSLGLILSGFAFEWGGIGGVWWLCLLFAVAGAAAMDIALKKPAARLAFIEQPSPGVEIRSS